MASFAKSVEFNSAEIKECIEKNKELGTEMKQLKKKNTELEMRAAELRMKTAYYYTYTILQTEIQKKMEFKSKWPV